MGRVRSESKIYSYIEAANKKIRKATDSKTIIKCKEFIDTLKYDEIDPSTLCRFGCPKDYIETTASLCDNPKSKAKYCDICSKCWYLALSEENLNVQKVIRKPTEKDLKELLEFLGYNENIDFPEFFNKLKKQKE